MINMQSLVANEIDKRFLMIYTEVKDIFSSTQLAIASYIANCYLHQ